MKLILFATIIFTHGFFATANAQSCNNWISVSELAKTQAGEIGQPGCKKGEKCFCYDGLNTEIVKVGMKSVDDKTKPIYEDVVETYEELIGYEQKQVDDETKPILDEEGNITDYEQKLVDDETKPIYEQVSKVVGQEIVGYKQKQVEGLIVDEQKKQARLEREAKEKAERQARQQHKERLQEAIETLADEISRDDQGKFLPKEKIRQNAKALKNIMKAK